MKVNKVTVLKVNYKELDRAISTHYGKPFDVVADQELNNDSEKEINIYPAVLDDYERKQVVHFKETGSYNFSLRALLIDMCNEGIVEPGNYLIEVSW